MDFGDLLFLFVFLLLPLLEGLFRKSKGPPKGQLPPRPTQRPRTEAPRPHAESRPEPREVPTAAGDAERPWWEQPEEASTTAVDVSVPDDVWGVLTGQRGPAEWQEAEEDLTTLEVEAPEEALSTWEEGLQRTAETRVPVVHEPPRVVSLETAPLAPGVRHAAFHQKYDSAVPRLQRRRAGPAAALGLRGRESLRRAVILKEVLGTPRGLDEWVGPRG